MRWLLLILAAAALGAQPVITDLQPRGVQKGRPFTLTSDRKKPGRWREDPVQHARHLHLACSRADWIDGGRTLRNVLGRAHRRSGRGRVPDSRGDSPTAFRTSSYWQ